VLYAFTFIAGLTLGPVIAQYTSVPGGSRVLVEAMILAAVVFAGSGAFGWMTSLNLKGLSRYLMGALLALIAVGLLLALVITSRTVEVAYDLGIALVFVAFTTTMATTVSGGG
jgi:FtsH-binding integral membrane protein